MVTQSEQVLENGLIKTLMEMNYEYISIKEEDNLYANFKKQLEKHNKRDSPYTRENISLIKNLKRSVFIWKEEHVLRKLKNFVTYIH